MSGPGEPLMRVRDLSKSFDRIQACRNVSFTLHGGEVLGIVGESGSGKTTLLYWMERALLSRITRCVFIVTTVSCEAFTFQ